MTKCKNCGKDHSKIKLFSKEFYRLNIDTRVKMIQEAARKAGVSLFLDVPQQEAK